MNARSTRSFGNREFAFRDFCLYFLVIEMVKWRPMEEETLRKLSNAVFKLGEAHNR